ncbi:MAG TPA: methylated-DNA--[protein]-cysteine S-methyltransferase [Flavobacterium sp.]|nr:methylated-DNA--[protein]-cysteine S-methyltransferase [Flavobacterium sp.]
MLQAYLKTPLGTASIIAGEDGVRSISVSDSEIEIPEKTDPRLIEAVSQLQEYFEGKRTGFTFKISPQGTEFQKKVWQSLLEIPYGKTMSYHELSARLGDTKAIRAVASANARNPLWIVVPCHRVIGSDGSLTGYAGGLWRKKWLLDHENPVKQQLLF